MEYIITMGIYNGIHKRSQGLNIKNACALLIQDNFLTQHVLKPTRAAMVLYLVLSSQKEFVDNVKIQEPMGRRGHSQLHFNI